MKCHSALSRDTRVIPSNIVLSLYHSCDSATIRLRYDDTTTHSTTTEVIEITIRLRYDYDMTTTKNWHVHFLLTSNLVEWKQARAIHGSRIAIVITALDRGPSPQREGDIWDSKPQRCRQITLTLVIIITAFFINMVHTVQRMRGVLSSVHVRDIRRVWAMSTTLWPMRCRRRWPVVGHLPQLRRRQVSRLHWQRDVMYRSLPWQTLRRFETVAETVSSNIKYCTATFDFWLNSQFYRSYSGAWIHVKENFLSLRRR